MASEKAQKVIAIEPSARINDVLSMNTREKRNVTVVPQAAWHCEETLEINRSVSPSENSILTPDVNDLQQSFEIPGNTVPNIVSEVGFDRISYLKIEAEGVEPEILRGALTRDIPIQKIAVDASPERDGTDTVDEVIDILQSHGYDWRRKQTEDWWGEYIVFARK